MVITYRGLVIEKCTLCNLDEFEDVSSEGSYLVSLLLLTDREGLPETTPNLPEQETGGWKSAEG